MFSDLSLEAEKGDKEIEQPTEGNSLFFFNKTDNFYHFI